METIVTAADEEEPVTSLTGNRLLDIHWKPVWRRLASGRPLWTPTHNHAQTIFCVRDGHFVAVEEFEVNGEEEEEDEGAERA